MTFSEVFGGGSGGGLTADDIAAVAAYTLQDLVAHVLDSFDLSDATVDVRRAKRAAIDGFLSATRRHKWASYNSQQEVVLPAAVSDGTVDIAADGTVTRAGHVWPSDVTDGELIVGDTTFKIVTRTSDTAIVLAGWPSGQTETGASYKLVYGAFLLDVNVRSVYDCYNLTDQTRMDLVSPQAMHAMRQPDLGGRLNQPHTASFQSVMVDGVHRTRMRVWPYPQTETAISLAYTRLPTTPRWCHDLGSVDIAADGTVTATQAIPLGSVSGAWLRVSGESSAPEAEQSFLLSDPVLVAWEGEVTARSGSNELTAAGAPASTAVGAVLTDVLDCPAYLLQAIRQYAEAAYKRTRSLDNRGAYAAAMHDADEELRYAMELDAPIERAWHNRLRQRGGRLVGHDVVAEA